MKACILSFFAAVLAGSASVTSGADWLIILNKSDNTASILDAKTGAAKATVPVGKGPHEVEVLAGGKIAAVSNYGTREDGGRSLTLIDIDKGSPLGNVEL